jgi:transposase
VSDTELFPKSRPEAVRRLEVFTGTGRRRTWSPAQKAEILAEVYEGGDTVSAVARRHGLTPQQLFGWRREAQRRAKRGAANDEPAAQGTAFVPVVVEEALPSLGAPVAAKGDGGGLVVEIVIGAATVRVAPGIDAARLTAVLRAVRAAT